MTTTALPARNQAPRQTRPAGRLNWLAGYALVAPPLAVMLVLIFFPALEAVVRTLTIVNDAPAPTSITFANYVTYFSNPVERANFGFTVWVTLVTVAGLFCVGLPLALYLRFSNSRLAAAVQVLALFPLFVPGIILAFALIRFLGPRGTLQTALDVVGIKGYVTPYLRPSGIIIGLIWDHIPFTVLVLTAGLRQIEDALIESARDVGASFSSIFTQIVLPLMQRPALIVFCLNVIGVFGAFTLPYLLGPAQPQMLGVSMQHTYADYLDKTAAETQAVLSFVVCATVGVLYVRTIAKRSNER